MLTGAQSQQLTQLAHSRTLRRAEARVLSVYRSRQTVSLLRFSIDICRYLPVVPCSGIPWFELVVALTVWNRHTGS